MNIKKYFSYSKKYKSLDKDCIFITGCPRSGTSMLTKVLDAHPDIGILMENIFDNRRRHWKKAKFWNDEKKFKKKLNKVYAKLEEPIVGNKVITPDVWSTDDIIQFCNIFNDYKIIWIVRNPYDVLLSRDKREITSHYNQSAKEHLPLNYNSNFETWASSWKQTIENYWRLKEFMPEKVFLVYYDDFIEHFEVEVKKLFKHLNISFHPQVLDWNQMPHYDANGEKHFNLKYTDRSVSKKEKIKTYPSELLESIKKYEYWYELWKTKNI